MTESKKNRFVLTILPYIIAIIISFLFSYDYVNKKDFLEPNFYWQNLFINFFLLSACLISCIAVTTVYPHNLKIKKPLKVTVTALVLAISSNVFIYATGSFKFVPFVNLIFFSLSYFFFIWLSAQLFKAYLDFSDDRKEKKEKKEADKESINKICSKNPAFKEYIAPHKMLKEKHPEIQAFPALIAIIIKSDDCINEQGKEIALNYLKNHQNTIFSRSKETFTWSKGKDANTLITLLYFEFENFLLNERHEVYRFYCFAINKKGFSYDVRLELLTTLFEISFATNGIIYSELDMLRKIAKFLLIKKYDLALLEKKFMPQLKTQTTPQLNNLEQCFSILQLSSKASTGEIKQAYRTLAKKFHPDLLANEATNEEKEQAKKNFHSINEAYILLCKEKGII